ncbi:hypothetical protein ZWY2020_021172 [Hordeum vulgare]|nr:hypothetical protein ZWY2020_021172 [Hordeum vulgare]
MIKVCFGLHDVNLLDWDHMNSVKDWWGHTASKMTQSRRPFISLMLLILWEVWKEWYARVFRNAAMPVEVIVAKIKEECSL